MKLVRWNPSPSRDLTTFHDEVTRLFDEVLSQGAGFGSPNAFVPALDVEETKEAFIVRADLPGMSREDIKVNLSDGMLSISGERRSSREVGDEKSALRRVERLYGAFERRIALETPVRNDKVSATYRDGVLEIQVPKAEEARVHEIEVKGG